MRRRKSVDLEKLRSLNFGGRYGNTARVRPTRNQGGRITTMEVDYADGRTEAVARPATHKAKVSRKTGRVKVAS